MSDSSFQQEINKICTNFKRLPYLFIGSGFSRRYLGIESWQELLTRYAKMVRNNDEYAFQYFENQANLKNLEQTYPLIASLIQQEFQTLWLSNPDFRKNHPVNAPENNTSFFKQDIANYLQMKFDVKKGSLLNEPEIIKLRNINNRNIAGIITTNYDSLLEFLFPQFTSFIGQNDLLLKPIFGINEIYKIHGCISVPSSIVITQEDYSEFDNKRNYLIAKLLTIFLENPIIFLGYSISDLNIQKILKSVAQCIPKEKRDDFRKRLIFVEWIRPESGIEENITTITPSFSMSDMLPMTQILLHSFLPLYEGLAKVRGKYAPKILQQLKRDIYQLVLTQQPTESVFVRGLDDGKIPSNVEFVIGVGVLSQFGEKGFHGMQMDEIYEDIVMDTFKDKYPCDQLFYEKIISLISDTISSRPNLPFYKYLRKLNSEKIPDNIKSKINQSFSDMFSSTENNNRGKLYGVHSIKEIISDKEDILKNIYKIKKLEEEEIRLDELENLLKQLLTNYQINEWKKFNVASHIRSLIRLYDWMKFKKEKGDR